MRSRRRLLRWFAVSTGLLGLAAIVLAPSWRNYHLPGRTVRIVEDLPYVPGLADSKHQLDLYLPKTRPRPWPVVVFVHGGFWKPFDRRMLQPVTGLHGCVGVALANAGVATAVLSYRQRPEAASIQDALDDVARAVRYVVDHVGREGGDPDRVYLVGHSAGALLTTLLATEPDHLEKAGVLPGRVRGFAAFAGPYDLARLATISDGSLAAKVRASTSAEDIERYSPERHVRPGHPPMLLLVGTNEDPFLIAEQQSMAAALRRVGGDVTTAEVPGEDHMDLVMHLSRADNRARAELLSFIEKHP
jgi:acetyl esterase/lipase